MPAAAAGVRLLGPAEGSPQDAARVPTFSFRPRAGGAALSAVVAACAARKVAVRSGHMYAHRLCTALGIEPEGAEGGVVRVSAVHYNTLQEVDRLCEALDTVL